MNQCLDYYNAYLHSKSECIPVLFMMEILKECVSDPCFGFSRFLEDVHLSIIFRPLEAGMHG